MRILLIDDDEQLMEVVASKLIEQLYAVDIANNGEMGWEFVLLFDFDLVVLDWMLPDIDGIELCQQIRAKGYTMPIMLLTARDSQNDKVLALDSGADDYVVKPFDFDELTARIRVLLRREINVSSPILEWQDLSLDPKVHEVRYQKQLLPLTPKEYGMIELFMRHPQQVFSPGAIINNLWAGEDPPGEEAVRTHIKGLRQKLKTVGMAKDTIKTVYGVGYRLKSDDDVKQKDKSLSTPNQEQDKQTTITKIWSKFKEQAFQRLADLENFAVAAVENSQTSELYQQAKSSAHKLAGSLGCFGFPEGSRIAKQVEQLLVPSPIAKVDLKELVRLIASLNAELQHQPFEETVENALSKNISLLIIDRNHDESLDRQLIVEANNNGMKTYIANDLTEAKTILTQESIDALLHKIVFPDGEDLEFLQQLHQRQANIPVVAIAQSSQLLDRLNFVQKGGSLFLPNSVEPIAAITAVSELLENLGNAAKVLIIDDDPQVLLSLEMSLEPWGFEITTLDKSTQFWEVLESVGPDILILDIDMPDLNGIELCQILRSDRYWQHLPVMFLSVHQDQQTQNRAFNIGADDYVCKPVTGSVLANRILNRLKRSKQ
ncbi:response regulator [Waterburya agarophytonicola K14]|uniref:Response regulator n=1 Tax=Waterburya agarophytonicola KI4 TaxID=2874699 RepID=A0A964BQ18_9CYAN|nr:response regulator [Waterburya agarophytonicola]MCC0176706.1 response regulator [Waterburya agarophytonicola KI4]